MLSIQECVNKTEKQRKKIEDFMDSNRYFDAKECNFYEGLKRSTQRELQETLRKLSLKELLFTPGGLTTGYLGTAGAQYLVPAWLSQKLYNASAHTDKVPFISADIFEPHGSQCTVPVGKLTAITTGEGGQPFSSYSGTGATITLQKITVPSVVTAEMIEDNEFGIVEWLTQQAGEAMGRTATNEALTVLKTATDGIGTKNSATSATTDTVIWSEVVTALRALENDRAYPNTMVTTMESWLNDICGTIGNETAGGAAGDYWQPEQHTITSKPPADGFDLHLHTMDILFDDSPILHDAADAVGGAFTTCLVIIFDRNIAMVTARKNWLRVENYSDPIADLAGAVVTGRQDSVTLVDEAIYVITEST